MTPSPALLQLVLARVREFYREPAAVFWVYGFPLLIALSLGIAFRDRPAERLRIDLIETTDNKPYLEDIRQRLQKDTRIEVVQDAGSEWRKRLRSGKTDLVVFVFPADPSPLFEIWDEKNRPESVLARNAVENILLREYATTTELKITDHHLQEVGSRYIDFLIPGLIGINLMGGGLFGVGFVIVDLRVRKLLKRFLATPMRRSDFMISIMLSRLLFTIPEVLLLLGFGYLIFDVKVQGPFLALLMIIAMGGICFAGIGLLVACRAKTIETISGLMNLVMLPMYVVSGVFFSSDRFPEVAQPVIKLLPLTALNNALRSVMLEGHSLVDLWYEILVMLAWASVSFYVALRFFRWR